MACNRQVTREEDAPYSLMGILGVEVSIAYGEGASRAFHRLIRELFNTKKNVIDLFNRSYISGEGLLPSSLELYRYRLNTWDYFSGGTYLDQYPPLDPIIPTHLGMRIPLLLAPCLLTTELTEAADKDYVAKGALSAMLPTLVFSKAGKRITDHQFHNLLCDSRLYTGDLANLRSSALPDGMAHICMVGIINFGMDSSSHIQLPNYTLALKLYWPGVEEGNFTPSGDVLTFTGLPYYFEIKSKIGLRIPKAKSEEHGLQLVTLHL